MAVAMTYLHACICPLSNVFPLYKEDTRTYLANEEEDVIKPTDLTWVESSSIDSNETNEDETDSEENKTWPYHARNLVCRQLSHLVQENFAKQG